MKIISMLANWCLRTFYSAYGAAVPGISVQFRLAPGFFYGVKIQAMPSLGVIWKWSAPLSLPKTLSGLISLTFRVLEQ